jgi:hypothetical protein
MPRKTRANAGTDGDSDEPMNILQRTHATASLPLDAALESSWQWLAGHPLNGRENGREEQPLEDKDADGALNKSSGGGARGGEQGDTLSN